MIYYYEIENERWNEEKKTPTIHFAHIILITHPGNNTTHALRSGNKQTKQNKKRTNER